MLKNKNDLLEKIWALIQANSKELHKIGSHVAVLNQEMGDVKVDIKEIKDGYVKTEEFSPIKKIVYGIVGGVLMAVLAAILGLVILK